MHTPGPWALQEGPSDEALHIYSKNKGFKITSNPGPSNIDPNKISGNRYVYAEERRANAKLIASAPDLLEALEGLLKNPNDKEKAKLAIRKAKG